MVFYVEVFVGAFLAGFLVALIAWAANKPQCTALRELPDKPIPMEHEHGGENCDQP